MWRVENRVVSDNADHAMDDLAINFDNIGNINLAINFGSRRILVILIIQ